MNGKWRKLIAYVVVTAVGGLLGILSIYIINNKNES